MAKLSVIILNWNGEKLLKQFLPAAVCHTVGPDVELVVADNGSTDNSVSWVRDNYPQVKLTVFGSNHGFAQGYNLAVAQAATPYVLLLNSDVEVTDGWWQPLLSFMESHPSAGAVQPKIKSWHNREMFEYAGAAGGYLDTLGYPYCRGRLFDSVEKDTGQYDGPPEPVCWASGAALLVRRDLYMQLGGLDSKFFAHMEEIDLCCRIHAAGYGVYALSDSEVYHVGGASLKQGNPKKTYLNFRNNLLLLHKNLPEKLGRRKVFLRMLADALAWAMFALKGDFANAGAVVRAHSDFREMRREYTCHPDNDILSSLPGAKRKAVIDRYLLRKKK